MREGGFRSMVRAIPVGGALLIGASSALFAAAGVQGVWVSSPIRFIGAWHLFVAVTMAVAIRPPRSASSLLRCLAGGAVALLLVMAFRDVMQYYVLLANGEIRSSMAVPLSIPIGGVLVFCLARLRAAPGRPRTTAPLLPRLAGQAAGALLVTLALLLTFGATDYRRRADCAIVLGAGVRDDGRPSLALSDRVDEGIRLYRAGLVDHLLMTGGTGKNGWSEPEVMKRMAVEAGVPPEAVFTDGHGMDTRRSADNCRGIMAREGLASALVVSHYYHLARCRMVFALAGIDCRTVPARMTRRLAKEPYYVLRECVGFLACLLPRQAHFRGLAEPGGSGRVEGV